MTNAMKIDEAVVAIYAARGYDKTADDLNVGMEIESLIDGAPEYGYALTSEGEEEFAEAGYEVSARTGNVVKMQKGKVDIYITAALDDDRLAFYRGKNLTFRDA